MLDFPASYVTRRVRSQWWKTTAGAAGTSSGRTWSNDRGLGSMAWRLHWLHTHTIHETGIFTYICLIYMVGKYTMHGSFEGYIWWNYREKIIILGNSMLVKRYSLARYVFLGWMEKILHSWSGQSVLPSISHGPFFKNIPWWCKKKPGTINSKKKPVSASLDPYQIQWKKWG